MLETGFLNSLPPPPNTHFSCCFPLIIVPQGLAFVWSNLLIFKLNVSCSFCPGMASVLREPGTAASLFPNSRAFVCGQSDVIYYMHSWADSRYGCKLGELWSWTRRGEKGSQPQSSFKGTQNLNSSRPVAFPQFPEVGWLAVFPGMVSRWAGDLRPIQPWHEPSLSSFVSN